MIKDDQGGTRNPYKCMNEMKQNAMNDRIKERYKTYEQQCMQEDLNRLRSHRAAIKRKPKNLDGSRICQEFIRQIESLENFFDGSRSCQ